MRDAGHHHADKKRRALTLADEMLFVAHGDATRSLPGERTLDAMFAEEVSGHRCVVRVSAGRMAMLGHEVATGRIVGAICATPPATPLPEPESRRAIARTLLGLSDASDAEGRRPYFALGDAIRNEFMADLDACPGTAVARPSRRDLDRHVPCWPVLEEVAHLLDRDVVALPVPYGTPPDGYAWLARRDGLRGARHALLSRYWFVGDEIVHARGRVDVWLAAGMPGEEIALEAAQEAHPGLARRAATARSRRRLVSAMAEIGGLPTAERFTCFRALKAFVEAGLPWDRLPSGCPDWTALASLQVVADGIEPPDPARYRRLLDVPGARYRDLWDRLCATPFGRSVREGILQTSWVLDRPRDMAETDVRLNMPHDMAGEANRIVHRVADLLLMPLAGSTAIPLDRAGAIAAAAGLVVRGRSATGLADAWDDWMRLQPSVGEALACTQGAAALSWPALTLRNPLRRGSLELRWLTTPRDLIDEGAPGPDPDGVDGLDHCVATYLDDALSGEAHILSVRAVSEDGTRERLSTAEFASNRDAVGWLCEGAPEYDLVQHRGLRNGEPPPEARAAVRDLLRRLNAGLVRTSPQAAARDIPGPSEGASHALHRLVRTPNDVAAMLAALEPMFARDLRGLGPDAFARAVLGAPRDGRSP